MLWKVLSLTGAFEHRLLDSLSVALAGLGDPPEPGAPLGGFGIHVVCDQNPHTGYLNTRAG